MGSHDLRPFFFDGFFFEDDFDGFFFDDDEDFERFDFDGELDQDVEQEAALRRAHVRLEAAGRMG